MPTQAWDMAPSHPFIFTLQLRAMVRRDAPYKRESRSG
jgi:hypothetical protein